MLQIYDDIEQGSPQWLECRLGLPTASMFATVMAKGKDGGASITRRKYLYRLAGEIMTGELEETYQNADMMRGNAMEDEARETYAFIHDAVICRVGFIRNGQKGASPDSLLGEDGGLEIKTAIPSIQIERLKRDDLPPEHRAQVQGSMWVAEREWWDFVSYWPRLPLFVKRVYRDESYIAKLAAAVDAFNEELAQTVEWLRAYDAPADKASAVLKNQLVQSVLAG